MSRKRQNRQLPQKRKMIQQLTLDAALAAHSSTALQDPNLQRGEYLRVTFSSTAQCDFWKQKIFAAIPADRNTA